MPVVEVDNLVKDYPGVRAVDHASFTVDTGEIFGFFGPNGAGKSTTMRLLTGLTRPDGGDVEVAGVDVVEDPEGVRERVAILPEVTKPYPRMTGERYLQFHGRLQGIDPDVFEARVGSVRDVLEAGDFLPKKIKEMSMGQRQRTELARLLLSDAKVLFMDEPFNSVDTRTRRRLRQHFRDIVDDDRTIFYTSHDLLESEELVDRYAFIVDGRIVATGSADDLRERHLSPRIRADVDDPEAAAETSREVAWISDVGIEDGDLVVTIDGDREPADLVERLVAEGLRVHGAEQVGTMEDVFEVLAEEGEA